MPASIAEQLGVATVLSLRVSRTVRLPLARVAVSFLGIDLLTFQVSSYSALDKIDVGVYVVTTAKFQKFMKLEFGLRWALS